MQSLRTVYERLSRRYDRPGRSGLPHDPRTGILYRLRSLLCDLPAGCSQLSRTQCGRYLQPPPAPAGTGGSTAETASQLPFLQAGPDCSGKDGKTQGDPALFPDRLQRSPADLFHCGRSGRDGGGPFSCLKTPEDFYQNGDPGADPARVQTLFLPDR